MVEDVSSLLDGVHQGGQVSAQASIPKDRGPTGSQALLPLLTDQRREEENGDAGGDVGPPEAQRARAGERAPGTVAAITSQAAAPAGAATLESETYKLEVSRGGKGRGD